MVEVQKSPQPAAPQITKKKNGARFKTWKKSASWKTTEWKTPFQKAAKHVKNMQKFVGNNIKLT